MSDHNFLIGDKDNHLNLGSLISLDSQQASQAVTSGFRECIKDSLTETGAFSLSALLGHQIISFSEW